MLANGLGLRVGRTLWTRLLDLQLAAHKYSLVSLHNGLVSLVVIGHLDESITFRKSRFVILDDLARADLPKLCEQFVQLLFCCLRRQFCYENLHDLTDIVFAKVDKNNTQTTFFAENQTFFLFRWLQTKKRADYRPVFCGGGWTRTTERIPGQIYSLLQLPLCDSPMKQRTILTRQKYTFFRYRFLRERIFSQLCGIKPNS